MNIFNITTIIISIIGALIAIFSAFYAGKQAKFAMLQAETAKDANKILQVEMKRRIVDECVVFYKQNGEWGTYLNSVFNLSKEDRADIDQMIKIRLKKIK